MRFLHPTFLFALFAISIPIIIHLFNFRRYKTVYFSNVDFLKNIKKESRKKSKIKQLLLLIARILTIVFLVFAFSQPYIPVNKDVQKKSGQIVAIYIDNSFSMNALSEQGQLLEVARNKAVEICMAYPPGTKFRLYTNDLKPKHNHTFNKEQFIQQVSQVQSSPIVIPISLIFTRFSQMENQEEHDLDKNIYFLSDFQYSITDIENFSDETVFSYFVSLKPNKVANLYIDSCWVEVPAHRLNQEEEVFVRIKNSSDQDYQNLPLKLFLNDSIKSITNFSVSAQNEIIASLKYTNSSSGIQFGKMEISDYPFTHDNSWFLSYYVEPNLNALAIFDENESSKQGLEYVTALFTNDDYIQFEAINSQNIQISSLANYNTIFLMNIEKLSSGLINELESVVRKGTSLVLFPNDNVPPAAYNSLLSEVGANKIIGNDSTALKISGIDFENPFFKDVFLKREENPILPEIDDHIRFDENTLSTETKLIWFQNNDKALSVSDHGSGKVWVFAFPLNKKSEAFATDVLFVPTLYNIVLNSVPAQEISYVVGKTTFYNLSSKNQIDHNSSLEIEDIQNGEKFIPSRTVSNSGIRIGFSDYINKAGYYQIKNENEVVSTLAFNYNREESELTYFTPGEIEDKLETQQLQNASVLSNIERNFSEVFKDIQNGKQLWKYFILLALIFILIEVLISRFWK